MNEILATALQYWPLLRDIASWALFLIGGAAVIVGSIGLVRFPDFYTRMHAAGITDTAGAELMLIAMALQAPNWQVVAKLVFIGVFLFFTSPTATHAVSHAAWIVGQKPLVGRELKPEEDAS